MSCLALLSCPVAFSDESSKPEAAKPDQIKPDPTIVQAVMYEFTYNAQTLAITHAQVIGGYPSVDDCRAAMPRVAAVGSPQLDAGEQMQLQCSGIRSPNGSDTPVAEPAVATSTL
jgi:hypothetical protein